MVKQFELDAWVATPTGHVGRVVRAPLKHGSWYTIQFGDIFGRHFHGNLEPATEEQIRKAKGG